MKLRHRLTKHTVPTHVKREIIFDFLASLEGTGFLTAGPGGFTTALRHQAERYLLGDSLPPGWSHPMPMDGVLDEYHVEPRLHPLRSDLI